MNTTSPIGPGTFVIDTDSSGRHYPHVYRDIKTEGDRTLVRSVSAVMPGGRMQYDHNHAEQKRISPNGSVCAPTRIDRSLGHELEQRSLRLARLRVHRMAPRLPLRYLAGAKMMETHVSTRRRLAIWRLILDCLRIAHRTNFSESGGSGPT